MSEEVFRQVLSKIDASGSDSTSLVTALQDLTFLLSYPSSSSFIPLVRLGTLIPLLFHPQEEVVDLTLHVAKKCLPLLKTSEDFSCSELIELLRTASGSNSEEIRIFAASSVPYLPQNCLNYELTDAVSEIITQFITDDALSVYQTISNSGKTAVINNSDFFVPVFQNSVTKSSEINPLRALELCISLALENELFYSHKIITHPFNDDENTRDIAVFLNKIEILRRIEVDRLPSGVMDVVSVVLRDGVSDMERITAVEFLAERAKEMKSASDREVFAKKLIEIIDNESVSSILLKTSMSAVVEIVPHTSMFVPTVKKIGQFLLNRDIDVCISALYALSLVFDQTKGESRIDEDELVTAYRGLPGNPTVIALCVDKLLLSCRFHVWTFLHSLCSVNFGVREIFEFPYFVDLLCNPKQEQTREEMDVKYEIARRSVTLFEDTVRNCVGESKFRKMRNFLRYGPYRSGEVEVGSMYATEQG